MSLDIYLKKTHKCPHCAHDLESEPREVFAAKITHNLRVMWEAAGVYAALYESAGKTATDILPTLEKGLAAMRAMPALFQSYSARNGWGTYEQAVPWLAKLVDACRRNPNAIIGVSR